MSMFANEREIQEILDAHRPVFVSPIVETPVVASSLFPHHVGSFSVWMRAPKLNPDGSLNILFGDWMSQN